jgi:hypothetical protein
MVPLAMYKNVKNKVKSIKCIYTIKQIVYNVKNTTILYNYWYFVRATCFYIVVFLT